MASLAMPPRLLGDATTLGGFRLPISPGYLYLRTCRTFQDTRFVGNVIFYLVIELAEKLAAGCNSGGPAHLKSGQTSLAAAAAEVRDVASLGASLICITGGLQLVQVLYEETVPEALLSAREGVVGSARRPTSVLRGYAMAHLLILCGAFVWGVGGTSLSFTSVHPSRLGRAFVMHLEFLARVIDGNVMLGCDPSTWTAYVSCFVGFLVQLVPAWVPKVRKETLRKLASGLRGWDEYELAHQLLECGGVEMVTAVVESVL